MSLTIKTDYKNILVFTHNDADRNFRSDMLLSTSLITI